MLHSLATAQVSLEDDTLSARFAGEILRGPARPDLIRDELLCEIFAATAAKSALRRRHDHDGRQAELCRDRCESRGTRPPPFAKRRSSGPGRRALDAARPRTSDRPDRHCQDGCRLASLDADAPAERVAVCLSDAEAWGVWTTSDFAAALTASCPAGPLPGFWRSPSTRSTRRKSTPARSAPARTTLPISFTPQARPVRQRES